MPTLKCKMCGGTIDFEDGKKVVTCEYCSTTQTLPRLDDDRKTNLYDRANHFRRNNEYDKAMLIYEQILNEDNTDAESYWSIVLCRYGIEYVEDPATHKRVPTVNRAQFTSVLADEDYKKALEYADIEQKIIYEDEAHAIDEIQKGILEISNKEEPFDVFICYKETDNNGRRTQDSVLATDLYHQLIQEGFKVFFSRITLEDKLGTAYEPYIFAALNSAKVMVVLGTKPEYFNAVWVKNEWSRYLSLVKNSNGKKILIPAYRDMDPYDLPEEFSHLQAQDMSKLGFMQDLIRGIKKIAKADEPKSVVKETVLAGGNVNTAPLLKRAFICLEDGEWDRADDFCEQVLNQDPENAQAYLGKLMAELHVRKQDDLKNCENPFDDNKNYRRVIRFGDESLSSTMNGYIKHINERNEMIIANKKDRAQSLLESGDYEAAYVLLQELGQDEIITANKKDRAQSLLESGDYEAACALLKETGDWELLRDFSTEDYKNILRSADLSEGDVIHFGDYNGECEWRVLDVTDNEVLIISLNCAALRQFDNESKVWANSSLRSWLNGEYYNETFNSTEKSMIMPVNEDNVFLLSIEEAESYFSDDQDRIAQYDGSSCFWWLCSPGDDSYSAAVVRRSGGLVEDGDYVDSNHGVRPALRLNLGS